MLAGRYILAFVRSTLLTIAMLTVLAGHAAAQGRVTGIVRDDHGDPVRGAVVIAENADASPSSFTASTDDRGRWAMIGLRSGIWTFRAAAPGHTADGGELTVRAGANPSLTFTIQTLVVPPSAIGVGAKELQSSLANAESLFAAQRWDEAITAYKGILDRSPSLSTIHLQIAAAYRNKKAFDDAIGAYNALLKIDPDNEKAKLGVAMTNAEKGDLAAAERTLETAGQGPRASREILFNLGEVKMARSRPDEAVKAYERAAEADPTWGKPRFALGRLAMDRGDRESARKFFQIVVDVDPASPEAAQASTLLQQLNQNR